MPVEFAAKTAEHLVISLKKPVIVEGSSLDEGSSTFASVEFKMQLKIADLQTS